MKYLGLGVLGLTEREFWDIETQALFYKLKAYDEREKDHRRFTALCTTILLNTQTKDKIEPSQLFPSLFDAPEEIEAIDEDASNFASNILDLINSEHFKLENNGE